MPTRSRGQHSRVPNNQFRIILARGDRRRTFTLNVWLAYLIVILTPALVITCAGLASYVYFGDDIVGSLIARQTELQYAYEDKLAAMRVQMDRVTSRQLLDQNTIEGRVHDLLSRQALLESRASLIKAIADQAGFATNASSSAPQSQRSDARAATFPKLNPLLADPGSYRQMPVLPPEASAFAPPTGPASATPAERTRPKPRPEGLELRGNLETSAHPVMAEAENPDIPVPIRLGALSGGLEHLERGQLHALAKISEAARQRAGQIKSLIAETGLSPERLASSMAAARDAMGGPFVPPKFDSDGSPFEQELNRAQSDFSDAAQYNRLIVSLPLRRPLAGTPDVTSGFGNRIDPFFGRWALHSGVDLRDDFGAPVRATAGGKIVSAAWAGGYGNMVEIDHGNGLSTRYGHLSSIGVAEGQSVEPGAIIGKLGSTGRSTGPHLHYEVRVDGEPVDPMRFVRASYKAAALN